MIVAAGPRLHPEFACTQILVTSETSKQPAGFKGVYKELNRIIAMADSDPRKFSGFAKHWSPQKVGRPHRHRLTQCCRQSALRLRTTCTALGALQLSVPQQITFVGELDFNVVTQQAGS